MIEEGFQAAYISFPSGIRYCPWYSRRTEKAKRLTRILVTVVDAGRRVQFFRTGVISTWSKYWKWQTFVVPSRNKQNNSMVLPSPIAIFAGVSPLCIRKKRRTWTCHLGGRWEPWRYIGNDAIQRTIVGRDHWLYLQCPPASSFEHNLATLPSNTMGQRLPSRTPLFAVVQGTLFKRTQRTKLIRPYEQTFRDLQCLAGP